MEERMLVKRAKRGDVDAFGELYQRIYKKLYAYALYTLKNPEDAEDAVSQAVVDAYQSIGQLKQDEAFSNWMYRIVANKCNRKMREFYHVGGELTQEVLEEKSLEMNPPDDEREMRFDFFPLTFFKVSFTASGSRLFGISISSTETSIAFDTFSKSFSSK